MTTEQATGASDAGAFNRETSKRLAATWAAHRAAIEDVGAPTREWMVRELAPAPGDTVLELAAGVGDTGFEIAQIIGDTGAVISTDLSPEMLTHARQRAGELGIDNVEFREIDAEKIDLDTDSVDGVVCRFGYMLMGDPAAALAETRRVLRPAGRLALAVWAAPEANPFFMTAGMSLVMRGHMAPPEPPPAPGIFSMASPERTTDLLEAAGFTDTRIEEVPVRFTVDNPAAYIDFVGETAGPLAIALQSLTPDQRAEIVEDAADGLAPFATADGFAVPGVALCAVAS